MVNALLGLATVKEYRGSVWKYTSNAPDNSPDSKAGATPPNSATAITPAKKMAVLPPTSSVGSNQRDVIARIAHGRVSAASQDTTWRARGEIDANGKPRLACSCVTMWTSILPEFIDGGRADSLAENARPSRPPRAAEHQLGGICFAGEVEQRRRHVVTDHDVHRGAQAGRQFADLAHFARGRSRQPVARAPRAPP